MIFEFLIGLFLANSLAHFVLSFTRIRFLSLFGFSSKGNLFYSLFNLLMSLLIATYHWGIDGLLSQGSFLGGLFILLAYYATGHFLYKRWHVDGKSP